MRLDLGKGRRLNKPENLKPNLGGAEVKTNCLGSKRDYRWSKTASSTLDEGSLDSEQRNAKGKSARHYSPDTSFLFVVCDFTVV